MTRTWATIGMLALAVVACGGGDGNGDDGAATAISVSMTEFDFIPSSWVVAAGEQITIDLENAGTIEHEWVLLRSGISLSSEAGLPESEEEFAADFAIWEQEVAAGESTTATFTAPAAGTYQVICAIPGHLNAGMEGQLIVE